MMMWKLFTLALGTTTVALAVLAIWQLVDRARLRQRYEAIIDLDREIAARRHSFNIELATKKSVFDSDIAARRRVIDAEFAKRAAEIEVARRNATQELADPMRNGSELRPRYEGSKRTPIA